MCWRLRMKISEAQTLLVLVNALRRNTTSDNLAEKTIRIHPEILAHGFEEILRRFALERC
jgi:hypothetical protein